MCDANRFNGMVATLEQSKTRERLSVTLHVLFINLALAGGESLALTPRGAGGHFYL